MTPLDNIKKLKDIVKQLRSPGGCPWDIEQSMQSITPHIIEEAYELVESIHSKDVSAIKEELGDVLLQVTMLSQMAEEDHLFELDNVAESACEKMIRRHPHVFGEASAKTSDDVKENTQENIVSSAVTVSEEAAARLQPVPESLLSSSSQSHSENDLKTPPQSSADSSSHSSLQLGAIPKTKEIKMTGKLLNFKFVQFLTNPYSRCLSQPETFQIILKIEIEKIGR